MLNLSRSLRVLLGQFLGLCLVGSGGLVLPIFAQELNSVQGLDELKPASNRAVDLLGQAPPATPQLIRITKVKLNPTDAGLEVILETETGTVIKPITRTEGNTLIAEISNATLVLTEGPGFTASRPVAGVATVSVTQADAKTVRVSIVGTEAVPTANVKFSPSTPTAEKPTTSEEEMVEGEEEEIVATGQKEEGYRAPNSSVGTKTDAPIKDVPQSIQVIPQKVLEDQGETDFNDALRNVSGVSQAAGGRINIRGFRATGNILRNGSREGLGGAFDIQGPESSNLSLEDVEQIEVLKGSASILYGSGEPGGTINLTTKQPEKEPSYKVQFRIGLVLP